MWRLYRESPAWHRLSEATQKDYTQCSGPLLVVFGKAAYGILRPSDMNRYLRVERVGSPVRANREMALASNLFNLAVERGDLEANPCRQIRRNPESPRTEAPDADALSVFLAWATAKGGQAVVLSAMAEFAAIAGNRRVEFKSLAWPQVSDTVVRVTRAKQRGKVKPIEAIEISPALSELLARLRKLAKDDRMGYVFPAKSGNAYTESAFNSAWQRLVKAAIAAGIVTADKRFTFHDLRAYYATHYKAQHGQLPDMHKNTATTARVYDRSKEVKRRAL